MNTTTRNVTVRILLEGISPIPPPGTSIRVQVPVGAAQSVLKIPANALRKGPGGDYVFCITTDASGKTRATQRPVVSAGIQGDSVLIASGLVEGEQVAASGSDRKSVV